MVFSSLVFLSVFLPLTLAVYFASPRAVRNHVLLVASLIFYAWGDLSFLGVMLGVIAVNYLGALALDSVRGNLVRRTLLVTALTLDFAGLVYYKYAAFLVDNFVPGVSSHDVFGTVVLPLGISFYTFQGVSYVVDVFRREVPAQRNILSFALFISYFPQLVAGPILKYHEVFEQIARRRENFGSFTHGLHRFAVGFCKKILVANTMGGLADTVFDAPVQSFGPAVAWAGAVAYALQIYYDFSGYSDMAIGLGAMFGFDFRENFRWPYAARSITEFWRRWHISLSTWFKEYLYIPLGGNRVSRSRTFVNLAIVFLATGIWHGAEWTFVAWGVWHGCFILLEKATGWHEKGLERPLLSLAHRAYLLLAVLFGWVLFRAPSMPEAGRYMLNMLGMLETTPLHSFGSYFDGWRILVAVAGAIGSAGVFGKIVSWADGEGATRLVTELALLVGVFLSVCFLAGSTYNPFIYFRF